MECANLQDIREKYFTVTSVRELFENVGNQLILSKRPTFITNTSILY